MLTFKDTDGGGVVIDASCGLQGSNEHRWRWDEIVCEGVVEVTLHDMISIHPATPLLA